MTDYFKWQLTVPDDKFLEDYWWLINILYIPSVPFNAPIVRFTRSAVVMVCVYSSICTVPPIETAEL